MKTFEEIQKIREETRKLLDLRVNTKADTREKHTYISMSWNWVYIIKIT